MPRAVGMVQAERFRKAALSFIRAARGYGQLCAGWPRHRPPPHAAFRTRCTRTVQRVRSDAHYAATAPRLARPASGGEPGKAGKSAALSHRAEAKPGPPHVVRIRTDTFLCPEKCPGCRVRWGRNRAKRFPQNQPSLGPDGAVARAVWARGGRVTVRRRTRRFGHAALALCSVFAPRRTTRRQFRGWLGFQLTVSQTNGSVRRPTSLPPSLPRQNGVGFSQLFWPGSHQGTGRVNPAVFPALPFLIAPVSLSFSSSRCYTGIRSTAKGGLLKCVSVPCGVFPCSAF